jgi:hypothetical protein
MDIQSLRASRNRKSDFSNIAAEFEKATNPSSSKDFKDDRFWKLTRDKIGNGSAVIRFLPAINDDNIPWIKMYNHGFQGPTGRWYIENSLTTIQEADPLSELNAKLWNSGVESDKEIARKQKRRLQYTCNILVISDPAHPENDGQVKLFTFGKKIFDSLTDLAKPTFADEKPINAFDWWEGCNFRLKIRQVDGWPSYDKSTWDSQSELFDGDEDKLISCANKRHDLEELISRKQFKTYEELSRKLADVLNTDTQSVPNASALSSRASTVNFEEPKSSPAPSPKSVEKVDENLDILAYFQSISEAD